MKNVSLDSVSVLSIGLVLVLVSTVQASAQPLVTSTPPGTTTDGVNITINPDESLPANGTVSISTQGATDTDMNVFPPEGVTVIITSDTVTVTNQAVDIATADEQGGEDDGGENGGEVETAEAADEPTELSDSDETDEENE